MSNPRSERLTGDQLARELAPQKTLQLIITENTTESTQELIKVAETIGQRLARHITTSQIRNIFGTVRAIEQDVKTSDDDEPLPLHVQRELQMLRPKLAYQYGRVQGYDDAPDKAAIGALTKILSDAISLVGADTKRFRNFVDFFEAILAYHRRYGGRTN